MMCRPLLLRVLVGLPVLGVIFYGLHFTWQGEPGQYVRDRIERRQDQADDDRRLDRHRAAGGLVGDLATGRVSRGHPLAAITADREPDCRLDYPPFTDCHYDLGAGAWLRLVARDGELIGAEWSWQAVKPPYPRRRYLRDGFVVMTPAEMQAHHLTVGNWYADRRSAQMAAGGPMGYVVILEPPPGGNW